MTRLHIYSLTGDKTLEIEGSWVDGTWVFDPDDRFSSIPHIDEHSEQMIIERFDGPYEFCAREEDMSEVISELDVNEISNPVSYVDEGGGIYSELADTAKDLAAGDLDTELYPEHFLEKLRNHPAYDE